MKKSDANGDKHLLATPHGDPFVSEHLFLFHRGENCRAYELLGAHPGTRAGKKGVFFRVWAPEAHAVHVTGDFCSWSADAHPMARISVGVWEAFIPGVAEYAMYKYLVGTADGRVLEKCDPYAFHSETRPQTASRVYDPAGYAWQDADWMAARAAQDPFSRPLNIYEVHLGSWRRNEDGGFYNYERLADELIPYACDMGYTHLELLPVMEHPLDASWGYQCLGYFAPTSRFGAPHDLMRFIDRCHTAGLGVILDWVPAHFPKDSWGLYEFDGSPLYEGRDAVQREHPSWGTRIFDYGRNEVVSFLLSSASFWLARYHVDGFRIDAVASMLYRDFAREDGQWTRNIHGGRENLEAVSFLRALNTAVFRDFPGVLMMAEESSSWPMVTRPVHLGGLGFNYKWNMGWMNDMLAYIKQDPIYRQHHHRLITFSLTYAFSENFVLPLSHDEVVHMKGSLIGKMPGAYTDKFAGLRALLGYMMVHPGKKLLFMGGEFAQFAEWNWATALDWQLLDHAPHAQMKGYVHALNHFYLANRPLWDNDNDWSGFSWIACDNAAMNIVVLRRTDRAGGYLVTVVNFAPVMREGYRIGLPEQVVYDEVFTSDDARFGGWDIKNTGGITPDAIPWDGQPFSGVLTVPPLGIAVFAPRKAPDLKKAGTPKGVISAAKASKREDAQTAALPVYQSVHRGETYDYDGPKPTSGDWASLLRDESVFTPARLDALRLLYEAPGHASTCRDLETRCGLKRGSYSPTVTALSRAALAAYGRFTLTQPDGTPTYFPFMMTGRTLRDGKNPLFEWTLRPELTEAIRTLRLF